MTANTLRTYTVKEAANLDDQLGGSAHSVVIDNYSASWAQLGSTGRFIAPFTTGAVYPLDGTQRAQVTWQAPAGFVQPTAAGGTMQLTYSADAAAYNGGSVVAAGPQGVAQVVVGTFTSDGLGTESAPFVIPQGTQSILLSRRGDTVTNITLPTQVVIRGQKPNVPLQYQEVTWMNLNPPTSWPFGCLVMAAQTPTITVAMWGDIGAIYDVIAIQNSDIVDIGSIIGPVTTKLASIPNLIATGFANTLAPAAFATIIFGQALQKITVYGFSFGISPSPAATGNVSGSLIGSASSAQLDYVSYTVATAVGQLGPAPRTLWIPSGVSLGTMENLRARNDGIAATLHGAIYYTMTPA